MNTVREAPFTSEEIAQAQDGSRVMRTLTMLLDRLSVAVSEARAIGWMRRPVAELQATDEAIAMGVGGIAVVIGMAVHVFLVLVAQPDPLPSRAALVLPILLGIAGAIAFALRGAIAAVWRKLKAVPE